MMSLPIIGSFLGLGSALSGIGSLFGMGQTITGLGNVGMVGNAMMQQMEGLQIENMLTNMMTNQLTSMASRQKMVMDAAAGIGSAYSSGASTIMNAILATNNELGRVLSKAGGH